MIGTTRNSRLWLAALLVLFAIEPGVADVLLVPEDHGSIADALGAAGYGDTVSLAVGSYYEHDLVLPPGVSMLGRGSRESVVIDAQGAGRVIWGENLDENNVLESFTIREGSISSGDGGGAYLSGTVILRDLLVEENAMPFGRGAGIFARHAMLIEDCVFKNNRISSMGSPGGGLFIYTSSGVNYTISRVDFIGNEAGYGAALYVSTTGPILIESVYVFENAGLSAIEVNQSTTGGETFRVENSVVAHNEASGIVAKANGTILSCTIVYCQGSGVSSFGIPEQGGIIHINNSIVAFNTNDEFGGGIINDWGTYTFLSCTDVYGNLPVNFIGMGDPTGTDGNISEDPLFCPESGPMEYFLRENSPCAPANNSCGVQIGAFPVGCGGTATQNTNWSRIKSLY